MTPCYVNGSRADNPNEDVIVLWNHTSARGTSATKQVLANYSEVGTVWGLAWHAQTKKLYAAAFLKRHADISPDGLGAIYEIDLTTPTTAGAGTPTLWMNLNSTTHLGAGATLFPSETAANRGLGALGAPSYDLWSFNRVGKEGLGDIDISADGTTMYVMDLTNRQVLEINMATKTVTNRYAVNAPAGYPNPADRRPFAVKHHNGQLYIGVVGSAESSYSAADRNAGKIDLRATVMQLSGGTFTTVFNVDSMGVEDPAFPGSTARYTSYRGNPNFGTGLGWYPNFTTDIAQLYDPNSPYLFIQHPVPLISDIEFDNNNNLVIGIMDWTSHRYGNANYMPDPAQTDTRLKSAQAHGDVIKANWNSSAWVKENALGRFYDDMQAIPDPAPSGWPKDTYVGGLVITDCNGTDLAVANMQDPFTVNEGGVIWMRTSDGFMQTHTGAPADPNKSAAAAAASRLRIFTGGFGKAAGLGDMVASFLPPCTAPTATAAATQPTCTGATANNNGGITISGFTAGQRYQYSAGATFNSGAATPATITAIPVGGVIVNNLPNTTQQYTVRIYDATDDACFVDRTVSVTAAICCAVTINSATTTACVPATNTYSLTVNVSWTGASGTSLTVTTPALGATPQVITTTAGSSGTQSVTFTGLTANATMYNVTAQFDAGCTATATNAFTAPSACTGGCPTGNCGSTTVVKRT